MSSTTRIRTSRFANTIGTLAVVAGMVLGLVPGVSAPAAEAADAKIQFSDFEIDGDTVDGGNGDFGHFPGSEKPADGIGNDDPTWFTQSTRESDYPGWTFKEKGSTPKADLIRNWIQTQTGATGENWVAMAVTRDGDNGNAQITAEFNKSELSDYTGAFRSPGDFYIRFNFPGNVGGGLSPEDAVAEINARYAVWNGTEFGAEQELNTTTDPAVRAAISSLDGSDSLTFIELIIDLEVVFGPELGDGCTTFGSAGFRSEATGGNENNDNTTLKDVIKPFPIDLSTCAPVTVEKLDADGGHLTGAEFTLYTDAGLSSPVPEVTDTTFNPCTTDGTGTCSFGVLEPGTYWIDETGVPDGYRKDPDLPDSFVVEDNTAVSLSYTDPRIPYTIDVAPDGENAVGNDHLFTVTLDADGAPLEGEMVNLSWSGVGDGITDVDGTAHDPGVTSTTCTTDVAGTCDVTVSSDDPGSGDLTASWDTPYQNTVAADGSATTDDGDGTTTQYASISDSAAKVWIGYRAEIAATGLNLVGQPHTFTATVYEVDGSEPDDVAAGVTVTFDWNEGTATGSGLSSPPSCDTDLTGTCTVVATDGGTPGTGTISIVNVDGTVGTDDEALSVDFTVGDISADKTWREYRVTIDDDSVNPSGEDHTFTATIEYRDDEALAWQPAPAGTTVSAYTWTGDGSVKVADSTCLGAGTTGGDCTFVVTSSDPGSGTLAVTEVEGALLGDAGEADETFAVSEDATKTWLDFEVDITPDGDNLVGEDHTFTIYVEEHDGTDYSPITDGSTVTFSLSDGGASYVSDTCDSTSGGACTVTVNSGTPGSVTLTATGITGYGEFDAPADITFDSSNDTDNVTDSAEKTWYDYRAFIAADGTNLVGDSHDFTVTAQVDDGNGWGPVTDGTVVTVSGSGLAAATIDQSDCADGTSGGTCTVTVDSDTSGTLTVEVETVGNESAVDSPVATVDVSDGVNLEVEQSTSAEKTWIAYRADIQSTATNLTGQQHVFTVTAEKNDGSGWTDVPDGTTVNYSTDNISTVTGDTCDSTSSGECTITVDSTSVGAVTVTIDSVSAEDVDGTPDATVANTALSTSGSLSATKTWIEVVVDVEADETNVVGENHIFTIDVDVITPAGTVEPDSGTLVASTSGVGSEVDQSCDDGLDADGQCTVEVGSTAPGDRVVTAETLTFTHDGTTFTDVDLDGAVGIASSTDLTATKTWRDYRVSIEAHDLNRVRESHTFTVTIEQTDDGSTWGDVPDGTTATVGISGTAGSITTDGTCETTGTTDGECTVVVNSATAGTGTVTVSEISVDLPEEQRTDIAVDVTNDSADKTWAAFRALISPDSVNVTGESHDFTLTGQYTVDGSNWLDVPDGSSIGFSSTGVGSTTGDTCDSTASGDCTVTVDSVTGGDRTVTVTGIDPAAITITGPDGDIVRDFGPVTLADEAVGIAPGTDTDVSATKTWASYTLQLEPATATNLLSGESDDTERFHTITATLSSDDAINAPVGGQTIDVSISGDTGVIDSVEDGTVEPDGLSATCITDTDGTCDIVIFSGTSGQATLSGSYEATVGDSEPVTVDGNDAVKTWTRFRVTVAPESAVNLVDNPHVFTVTVEQSDSSGNWDPVVGAVPTIGVEGTDLTIDPSDCDAGTDAQGQCTVSVTSSTVQAVTLTATHTESYDDYDSEVEGQSTVGFTDSGDKDWIDYAIDVTPDTDENLVNTDHVFTVTVTTTFPTEGGATTAPVVGGAVDVQLDGLGSITDNDCADGTDADGQCTVTISSSAAGASSLTATYMGTATDDDEVRSYDDTATKGWVAYELVISDDAVNAVGDEHTFTATLTVDTGEGFGPAAGETLAFTVDGVGTVTGGDTDEALECTTDEAGECDLVINSGDAGTSTVGVSYTVPEGSLGVTAEGGESRSDTAVKQWVDIELVKTAVTSDGFSDGDLIADPGGFPFLSFTSSDQGPKTAVFEYLITNPSNVTLEDVALVDDRLGTIDLSQFPDCQTLAPGESCTARGSEQFDYDDATGSLASLITNVGTVTATGGGEEVSDTDDATITLVAVQSSILIDLVKDVVAGAGDVEAVDGRPIVNWSQEEYEAGATKTVRYRFTVTNISNSPIIDVELIDPMVSDEPIIAKADGVTLQPGESTVVEVDHELTVDEAFPDGPIASKVDNVATVSGANETRDSFSEASDDASVFTEIVFAEVLEKEEPLPAAEPLPATGFGAGGLLPVSMLLITIGAAVLWLERRRVTGR